MRREARTATPFNHGTPFKLQEPIDFERHPTPPKTKETWWACSRDEFNARLPEETARMRSERTPKVIRSDGQ